MSALLDYVKCCIKNKFTLAGYIGIVGGAVFHLTGILNSESVYHCVAAPVDFAAICCLCFTGFGLDTYDTYVRIREHINDHGTLREGHIRLYSSAYCTRMGLKMAADEASISFD